MAEPTINESMQDAQIAHAVGILRYRSGVSRRMLGILELSEGDLRKQLTDRLEKISERGYDTGPVTTKRIKTLLAAVSTTLNGAYGTMGTALKDELFAATNYEAGFQVDLLKSEIGIPTLALSLPPPSALKSIVTHRPIGGKLLDELVADAAQGAVTRANTSIRLGLVQGETRPQIVARVLGNNGLGLSKRGLTSMVQTAVTNVMAQTREDVFDANSDIVAGVRWVSTLDSRTSPICQALDGKIFPLKQGIRPPAHINCRSSTVPMLDGQSEIFGDRASSVGPVPAKTTYGEWLRRQPDHIQDEVLGVERAKLFRASKLPLDRFVDNTGAYYTLDELANIPGIGKPGATAAQVAARRAAIAARAEAQQAAKAAAEAARVQAKAAAIAAAEAKAAAKAADAAAAARQLAGVQGNLQAIDAIKGPINPVLKQYVDAISKANPALSPSKVLKQAVIAQAETYKKAQASITKTGATKKYVSGEPLTAIQQAFVDALPPEEFNTLFAEAMAKKALVDELKIAKITGSPISKELAKAEGFLTKPAKAAFDADVAAAVQASSKATALAAKVAQQEAAAAATAAAEAANAAVAIPSASPVLDITGWKVTRPKTSGSVPGAFYQDNAGVEWLVKRPLADDIARNEVLAAQLYRVAGSAAPDVRLIKLENGQLGIASRVVQIRSRSASELASLPGVHSDYIVDAWLANWDAVGLDYDNIVEHAGQAIRIDVGGALRYRAQGGLKGASFGDEVTEVESLRTPLNPQSAQVFKGIKQTNLDAGARKVLAVTDAQIDELVDAFGPSDADDARDLKRTLKARREDIAAKFPHLRSPKVARAPDTGRVTVDEQVRIEAARSTGYSIRTDSGELEDQRVIITVLNTKDGKKVTRATLKVRPEAAKLINTGSVPAGIPEIDVGQLESSLIETLKGLGSRARGNMPVEAKDLARAAAAVKEYDRLLDQVFTYQLEGKIANDADVLFTNTFGPWVESLRALRAADVGINAAEVTASHSKALFVRGGFKPGYIQPKGTAKAAGIPWRAHDNGGYEYEGTSTVNGTATFDGSRHELPGDQGAWFSADLPGGKESLKYIPYGQPGRRRFSYSAEGSIQIDIAGAGAAESARAFEVLKQIGLNAERVTDLDAEELYLRKIGNMRFVADGEAELKQWNARFDAMPPGAERNAAMLTNLKEAAGFDFTKSPEYQATRAGVHQAFESGHLTWFRPDIKQKDFDLFASTHAVYHNPTGLNTSAGRSMFDRFKLLIDNGGQLSSLMDRARRGIPRGTTSAGSDMDSGGGNSVYTRIRRRSEQTESAGFWWRAKTLKRLDSRSFKGDLYGNAKPEKFDQRGTTISEWKKFARNSSNETNFKDGLSLFDDLQVIIWPNQKDALQAIAYLRSKGYTRWPDGRTLEQVNSWEGNDIEVPD